MGPKVEAAVRFVERTGRRAAIGALTDIEKLVDGVAGTQVVVNPSGTGTVLTKAATKTDVDASTFDVTATINGTTEFTNAQIATVAVAKGTATTGAGRDTLSRSVRSQTIGVQAGDAYTRGVRVAVQDNS